ncbi:WD40 repeat domain-containing protein [Paenibacillus sp. IB182496]|uniref:WD40 repeat domain-containing protein n=1 Tax=Paenibacillus sabuli TaxID=2772509 RepID=A0A927GQA8_9BACL|nr:WD40 repeat domain-containing protein [Paenibacillus sabuli]MBD2843690.1 WD40 repeat domain-containing protein [Paenibacillus sabuli]
MSAQALGEPLDGLAIWASAFDVEEGEPRIYAVSTGNPCMLHVIDPIRCEALHALPLEGSDHSWGVVSAPSGVYIGGSGVLYRYTPERGVEHLGEMIAGEYYTWRLAVDEAGRIYGGCYPGGKVFGYDPATGRFRDYGVVAAGEQYARCMQARGGKLYVGAGTIAPHLVVLDIESGAKTELPLPPECAEEQLVYDLDIALDRLFVRITPSSVCYVYDLETREWTDRFEGAAGLSVSSPDARGAVYFVKDDALHRYEVRTRRLSRTSLPMAEPAGDYGWLSGHPLQPEGPCLLGVGRDGSYWVYAPERDVYRLYDPQLPGLPVRLQALAPDGRGTLYGGGYFAGGLAVCDTRSGALTGYRGLGQAEGMLCHDGLLYIGVYPKALIHVFDPARPFVRGDNPRLLFTLQGAEQDRPFAFASCGEEVAIGTVPAYGRHGGALALYAPGEERLRVHRHVLPGQSVVALAVREGLIYAGGSIWGGLGAAPVAAEAELLIWDPTGARALWRGVPIPGAAAVAALAFDASGALWGLTPERLFCFDPATRRVTQSLPLPETNQPQPAHFWRAGSELVWQGGVLYATARGLLLRYDPREARLEVLEEDARLLAADGAGALFYARGATLMRYAPSHLFTSGDPAAPGSSCRQPE